MKLYKGLQTISQPLTRSTVAIGSFDGVHLGHQALIQEAVEDAGRNARDVVVFTFDRHPAELLRPEYAPEQITTSEQRNALIDELGVDIMVIATFDTELANTDRDTFLSKILKGMLGAEAIVEGKDFCFGKNRGGDVNYLLSMESRYNFELHALNPVIVEGAPASSSRIRELLRAAQFQEAEKVLGHGYYLYGLVVHGQHLGRKLGFPTINLVLCERQVIPKDGIYAVLVTLQDGRVVQGACSIGNRPTVESAGRSLETYLLDFNEDLYGQKVSVRFICFLRSEIKFDSLEELVVQMTSDVLNVREVLKNTLTL